jgi:aminopeptidase YwaD
MTPPAAALHAIELDAAAIGATLDDLAQIGSRFAGGESEARCRDYLLDRFNALGLTDVRLEELAYLGVAPGEASCVIDIGEPRSYECRPLQYTANGPVSGPAVYVGQATEEDLLAVERLGVDLRGAIVIAHTMFPFDLIDALGRRGVAGLVHVCETPEGIVGNFAGAIHPVPEGPPWTGRPTAHCGVTINDADGRRLLSTLSCAPGTTVTIGHDSTFAEATGANVVGVIPGSDSSAGEVVICAHYDSQYDAPGVYDNGSGLASMLDTARALRDSHPLRRIVIVATAAEEIGCWGATAYVRRHADELRSAVAMVNFDGLASAYPSVREIWSAHDGLADLALHTANELGWHPDNVHRRHSTFSDHAPFADAGVPSCLIWQPDHPYYHSRGDVRERVDSAILARTAGVSATLVARLARGDDPSLDGDRSP